MTAKDRQKAKRTPQQTNEKPPSASVDVATGPDAGSTRTTSRLTPCERMRQLLAANAANTRVVSSVEELQDFLKTNRTKADKVTIRMKLIWASQHRHQQLKFARLHFVDAESPEPLEELLKTFRDPYEENMRDIDEMLFTATAWNVDAEDPGIPPAGSIVDIASCANLGLFRDVQCQATIRLTNLTWT